MGKVKGLSTLSLHRGFRTARQQLKEKVKRERMGKHGGRGTHVWRRQRKRRRGEKRQQRGRGVRKVKGSGGAKRLIGDEPVFPPTDYIFKRTFELRKDIYNGYK